MLKLVEIQIVVTTLIDHFLFFLQFSVMCWDIYWNIHVLIWASWVHPIYCDICFVLPSASDILRYILSCRTIAIYDPPINLRYIYKRVSPLVGRFFTLFSHRFPPPILHRFTTAYSTDFSTITKDVATITKEKWKVKVCHGKPWDQNSISNSAQFEATISAKHRTKLWSDKWEIL